MSDHDAAREWNIDAAPGDQETGPRAIAVGVRNYLIGLVLAAGLTAGLVLGRKRNQPYLCAR